MAAKELQIMKVVNKSGQMWEKAEVVCTDAMYCSLSAKVFKCHRSHSQDRQCPNKVRNAYFTKDNQ
jgi:hypothetical protein